MTSCDDWKKTIRLNKLLGMWAAEKWESRAGTPRSIRTPSL